MNDGIQNPTDITGATDPAGATGLQAALDFLAQLSQVVVSNTELQPILDWMVEKTSAMVSADEGSIRLLGPDMMSSAPHTIVRKPRAGLESGSWEPPVSMSVMGFLLTKGETLSTPDLLTDPRFPGLKNVTSRVRSVLAAPLRVANRVTGMLAVTTRTPGRQWTPGEIQLLSIVASHSGEAIEKARLRAEAEEKRRYEEEQRRYEREFAQAADIQMSLVPSKPLVVGPWEVIGRVIPARHVGGDYFDYFPLGEDRFGVTIADVSGKGLPAAIMMSNVQASLRAYCDGDHAIDDAMRRVNRSVARSAMPGKFITLFYGEVDAARNVLRYSNAGHNFPLLRRVSGTLEELSTGGLMLGPIEDAVYEVGETTFSPGDTLLLYSDGVSEAMDTRDHEYGEERLRATWERSAGRPIHEMMDALIKDVEQFRGSKSQSDDITVVVVGPRRDP
jgi:sigma-B regulation protein RsbU (phosphoserine phosphatase)